MKYTIAAFAHLLDHNNLCANETSEVQSKFCARNYREMKLSPVTKLNDSINVVTNR